VLEFEPYGDLREVVMLCKEKGIVMHTEEIVTMMKQCADGCGHIASKRMARSPKCSSRTAACARLLKILVHAQATL
jgi:hypothetical protein